MAWRRPRRLSMLHRLFLLYGSWTFWLVSCVMFAAVLQTAIISRVKFQW